MRKPAEHSAGFFHLHYTPKSQSFRLNMKIFFSKTVSFRIALHYKDKIQP